MSLENVLELNIWISPAINITMSDDCRLLYLWSDGYNEVYMVLICRGGRPIPPLLFPTYSSVIDF